MNILIIYPEPDKKKHPRFGFSYEMLTIATILSSYHKLRIFDYSCEPYNAHELSSIIENDKIDLILLECDTFALKRSQNLINAKEIIFLCNNKIPIIAYGNYCYITKKDFYGATYTVYDNNINNIIKYINELSREKEIPFFFEYDSIPHINRNILFSIDFYRKNKHCTLLQTAKGCKNTCIFCQRKGWQGDYVPHSDAYVLSELEIIKQQGYTNVWITDENFTFNLSRAKRLLSKIDKMSLAKGMKFFISSWANIDEEFLDLAVKCNINIISFGIESGDQNILNFYKKNIQLKNIYKLIRYANSLGIFTVGNFILGAPMETDETILKTFSLIKECEFDQINIKILDYMIGSELYNFLPEHLKKYDHVFASAVNGLTSFTLEDLINRRDDFIRGYYSEHRHKLEKKIKHFGTPYFI